MRKAVLGAAVAVLLAVTGCGYEEGPAGRVVDKSDEYQPATKTRKYELTVRTADGSEHEFEVSISDYSACYRGSAYPTCTEVR